MTNAQCTYFFLRQKEFPAIDKNITKPTSKCQKQRESGFYPYLIKDISRTNTIAQRLRLQQRCSHRNTAHQYFCPYVTSHTRFVTHLGSGEYFFSGWLLVEHITVTVTTGKEKKEEKERKRVWTSLSHSRRPVTDEESGTTQRGFRLDRKRANHHCRSGDWQSTNQSQADKCDSGKNKGKNAGKPKRTTHVSFFWEGGKGWECGGLIEMARKLLANSQLRKSQPKLNFLVSFLIF